MSYKPAKNRPTQHESPKKERYIQVETKNAILELLRDDAPIIKIMVANNAHRDPKTKEIIKEASSRQIPIEKMNRKQMNRLARSSHCESIIAFKPAPQEVKLSEILEEKRDSGDPLFALILNEVQYAQNIGALLRSAYGAGVDVVVVSKRKSKFLTEEVTRISMGASERVPVVQMSVFSAIKELHDFGLKIIGVHMDGQPYHKVDMKGDVALVVGSEDRGVSQRVLEKCDALASIPMEEGLGSLNVSVAGAILMFEKKKQDET